MNYPSWIESLKGSIAESGDRLIENLPNLLIATVLVLLGLLVAWVMRLIAVRLVARIARLVSSRTLEAELRESGVQQLAPRVVGGFVYWVVLLFFFAAAAEVVGLTVVTAGVSQLARYLPQILAALLVVLAGVVLANLTRRAVSSAAESAGIAQGELIGRTARVVILLVAGIVALDQMGIDSSVLNVLILIVVGALLGGSALAFGLGARTVVANLVEVHYLTRIYRPGQTIRLGDVQGRIVEFTSTGVILQNAEGRVLVPGTDFGRNASILIGEEG